jgi:hypothetical protein
MEMETEFPFDQTKRNVRETDVTNDFYLPHCTSDVIYTNGMVDVQKTIYNCSDFAPAPYQIPSSL